MCASVYVMVCACESRPPLGATTQQAVAEKRQLVNALCQATMAALRAPNWTAVHAALRPSVQTLPVSHFWPFQVHMLI